MTKREWEIISLTGQRIQLEHNFWSGKASIYQNGKLIFNRNKTFWDTGFEHRFIIDEVPCIIRVIARAFHFTYELWVDGKLQ